MPKFAEKKPNPRREAARELARKISQMSEEDKAAFIARFPAVVTVDGRALSGRNAMLVLMQCETATIVGGFRQWINAGRCVRKGEQGLWIWIPSQKGETEKSDAWLPGATGAGEAATETRFFMAPVFDVSQTAELEATVEAEAA